MASAEKKEVVVKNQFILTLSEQEAQLLATVLGRCVSWADSPGAEGIFNALLYVGVDEGVGDRAKYLDECGMFAVKERQ